MEWSLKNPVPWAGILLLAGAVPRDVLAEPEPPGGPGPRVSPTALFQIWGTAYDQDLDPQADPAGYGDPEDDPGFKIRRARIGLAGDLAPELAFEVLFGAESPYDTWSETDTDVGLVDASFTWHRAGFSVSAGQQKVPYSREQLISARDLVFTERAVSTAHLVPDRETGVVGGWRGSGLDVRLGAFNGTGSFLGDDNTGMLLAGRVEYANDPHRAFTTWGQVDSLTFAVAGNGYYDDDLSTRTVGFGGDFLLRVSGLALLVEAHHVTLEPTSTDVSDPEVSDTTPRLGGMAQVGYTVGPLEPAVRVSMFDDHTGYEDNGDVLEVLGGVTWHLVDDVGRLGLGYVHRQERAGRAVPNDTVRAWGQVRY